VFVEGEFGCAGFADWGFAKGGILEAPELTEG